MRDDGRAAQGAAVGDQTASLSPDERARRGHTPPGRSTPPDATPVDGGAAPTVALPVDPTERYELAGVHARGGLGRIVKAVDRRLGRTVAIKELLHRTAAGEARFVREALITARLEHPGIVPVHEAGRWPSGDPYYAMKLVSGRTLKELIQARATLEERLALLPHVIAVAEAIGYAHSLGVIHRDVKPANVVVGDFGETVVVDWGLAKVVSGQLDGAPAEVAEVADDELAGAARRATVVGKVMGTPAYMSPEQARGDEVDARADVFSLGALLHEVLIGEPPYRGESTEAVLACAAAGPGEAERAAAAGPLRHAPPDLVAILWKALARFPEDRYANAKELAEDLKRFQTGKLVTAHTYATRTLVRRWMARHRALVTAAAGFVAAATAVGALAIGDVLRERDRAERHLVDAEQAKHAAEARSTELIYLQADSSLRRDPTAAVAWLKDYPARGPHAPRLGAMLDEARAHGVARHIWRDADWMYGVAFVAGGQIATAGKAAIVSLRDPATGATRVLGRHLARDGAPVGVLNLEASPDGARFATIDEDGGVMIWDVATGGHVAVPGQGTSSDRLAWSRGGRHLLVAGADKRSRLIDAATGVATWTGPPEVMGLALLDGDRVVLGFDRRTRALLRVPLDGGAPRSIATLPAEPTGGALSPDQATVVLQGRDDVNRAVDLVRGAVRELGRQPSRFGSVDFSPDGARVATAGTDMTIRIYDLAGGGETVLRGHDDSVYQALFTPDGQRLVSSSDDATIRIWDLPTGEVRVLRGHEDDVVRVAIAPDGQSVASAGLDGSARLWPIAEQGARVHAGPAGELVSLQFAPDGELVTADAAGRVVRWDLASGAARAIRVDEAGRGGWSAPLVSPDARWAAAAADGVATVLELDTGDRRTVPLGARVAGGAFSVAGDRLATFDEADEIVVWSLPALARTARLRVPGVAAIGFSPDGATLAIAAEGSLTLHDAATGAERGRADLGAAGCDDVRAHQIVWSDDGRFVAAASKRGGFPLWEVATGAVRRLEQGNHYAVRLAFSPDGRWLASAGSDRRLRLWDTATGATEVLAGHGDLLMSVAWSPDGARLASASYDKTVRLWTVGSWQARVLRGHAASVDAVAFTADGRHLVSGARDGTLRIWELEPADAAAGDLRARMAELTSAEIAVDGRPTTPAT